MFVKAGQQSWMSGRAQNIPGCRPEFAPQAALIAKRLTKLVAPPNGYSITRLY